MAKLIYDNVVITGGGGGGSAPSEYIKSAVKSADGNTLTLTKQDDSTVVFAPSGSGGGQTIQYSTMPTAESSIVGKIAQYIGTTDTDFTNGFFYECVNQAGVYSWVRKSVQNDSVDGTTIERNSSDELIVKDGAITATKLGNMGAANAGKLFKVDTDGSVTFVDLPSASESSASVTAQTSVTITHTLSYAHPYIVCVDGSGNTVHPSVEYVSATSFKLEFSASFTGTIYYH